MGPQKKKDKYKKIKTVHGRCGGRKQNSSTCRVRPNRRTSMPNHKFLLSLPLIGSKLLIQSSLSPILSLAVKTPTVIVFAVFSLWWVDFLCFSSCSRSVGTLEVEGIPTTVAQNPLRYISACNVQSGGQTTFI